MKNIKISDELHERLKIYCKKYGYKFSERITILLNEYLDLLETQKEKGYTWIEKK